MARKVTVKSAAFTHTRVRPQLTNVWHAARFDIGQRVVSDGRTFTILFTAARLSSDLGGNPCVVIYAFRPKTVLELMQSGMRHVDAETNDAIEIRGLSVDEINHSPPDSTADALLAAIGERCNQRAAGSATMDAQKILGSGGLRARRYDR